MIPDDAIAYVVGYGEMTVGQIVRERAEAITMPSSDELTIRHMVRLCTEDLRCESGLHGAIQRARKESTGSRSTSVATDRASTSSTRTATGRGSSVRFKVIPASRSRTHAKGGTSR